MGGASWPVCFVLPHLVYNLLSRITQSVERVFAEREQRLCQQTKRNNKCIVCIGYNRQQNKIGIFSLVIVGHKVKLNALLLAFAVRY